MINTFIAVLNMSLTASFVALAVMIVRLLLKKAPKVFSYALWILVLFRLICPFTIQSALSLIPVKPQAIPKSIVYSQAPVINSGIPFIDNRVNVAITNSVSQANPASSVSPIQTLMLVLACVWLVGIGVLLGYSLVSYYRLKYHLRTAIPVQGNIYETDRIKTAFVMGIISPKIYLPVGLSRMEFEYIVKHEQTHIKRFDYLIKPLAFIAVCVHWFNPVVWVSYIFAMGDMEMSCDESVIKGFGADIRADYSTSLLLLSAKRSGLLSPLAFGETGVKARIRNVLNYRKPAFWVSTAAVVAIIAAAVVLLPNVKNGGSETGIRRDPEGPSQVVAKPENSQEILTLEYSDESGSYTENYIKEIAGEKVTLLTHDSKKIISGEDVIPLPYVYAVKNSGKYDMFDKKTLSKVSDISYDEIYCQRYPDGRLSTAIMKGRVGKHWGLVSAQGNTLTYPQNQPFEDIQVQTYEEVWPIITVKLKSKYGAIDYKGNIVIEAKWDYLAMDVYNVPNTVFVFEGSKQGGVKLDKNLRASAVDYNLAPPEWIANSYKLMLSEKGTTSQKTLWFFDYLLADSGFKVLGGEDGRITDGQMAIYAIGKMNNYSYENGNTKEEYNVITQKYFGRNIEKFTGNGATKIIPGTDRIRATGWSFNSSMFAILKSLSRSSGGVYTGEFYCLNVSDSHWQGAEGEFEKAKNELLNGDISSFADTPVTLKQVIFEEKQDEKGDTYLYYRSVKDIQNNVTVILPYTE